MVVAQEYNQAGIVYFHVLCCSFTVMYAHYDTGVVAKEFKQAGYHHLKIQFLVHCCIINVLNVHSGT